MIKKLFSLLIIVAAMVSLTSCLSDTDVEVTYYDDTAITAFSLGTINRYNHTTKTDGTGDSIYVTKIAGSSYKFYIDQVNALIYNPDSLPVNCDAKHVICSFSTKNGGVVMLKLKDMWGRDSIGYYQSTDSIDLSTPIKVRVYSNRGNAYKEYVLKLNVHKQTGDEFAWGKATAEGADQLGARRFAQLGNSMWLFCQASDKTIGYQLVNGSWQKASELEGDDAYKSVATLGNSLYTYSNGYLYQSADGVNWSKMDTPNQIKQIIGGSGSRLYALTTSGLAYTTDGQTWVNDALDSNADALPESDINLMAMPSKVNANTNNLTLIGNRNGKTVVWTKVEENGEHADNNAWALLPEDSYNQKTLPCLEGLQVVVYDGGLLATGSSTSLFYKSLDHGLTWSSVDLYATPIIQANPTAAALFCDSNNILYFSKAQLSTVLSGRLARLGWKTEQTSFNK